MPSAARLKLVLYDQCTQHKFNTKRFKERPNMANRQAGLTRENLSHLGLLVGGALALTVIQIHVLDW